MAEYLIQKETLTAIADAVREKTGNSDSMSPSQMADEIRSISSGGGEEWIGDGNTHLWVSIIEGRQSPVIGVGVNGTVTVDWGDGTAPDVLTGTYTWTVQWTSNHNYENPGDYIITLTVDGTMSLQTLDTYPCLFRHSSVKSNYDHVYRRMLRKIEFGKNIGQIKDYSLYSFQNLTDVYLPEDITYIGNTSFCECAIKTITLPESATGIYPYAFQYCKNLEKINLPEGLYNIGNGLFSTCYSLTSLKIPSSVTSIGNQSFYLCYGMRTYDFSSHTLVPALTNVNAFQGIPSDCEIRVPAALAEEWKAAENWATYADYIVGV